MVEQKSLPVDVLYSSTKGLQRRGCFVLCNADSLFLYHILCFTLYSFLYDLPQCNSWPLPEEFPF